MEEVINIEDFLKDFQMPLVSYVAVFNPETGEVISVGPSTAFKNEKYTVSVDDAIALSIIDGKTLISNCFVDITGNTLEIAQIKSIFKMDDVLHRIVEKQWSNIEKPDVYITYTNNSLIFELSEEYKGTYKQDDQFQPVKSKKVMWDGETSMTFLVSTYNDPNVPFKLLKITLSDLIGNSKIFNNLNLPCEKFSIYTRRIFKNYVFEAK
jgi:hypothetical protein